MKTKIFDTREFREMWTSGVPQSEIARRLGVSKPGVYSAAKRYGYPARDGVDATVTRSGKIVKRWSAAESEHLTVLIGKGVSYDGIAEDMRRSQATVWRWVRNLGLQRPKVEPAPIATPGTAPKPVDTTLPGRLRATTSHNQRAQIADEMGWTQAQVQQRYHRVMAGGAI